jgi:hypothetical protein
MQSTIFMSVVRRKKENIDMLEHAMMGVRTSETPTRIVSFEEQGGLIGSSSRAEIEVRDENLDDREVIVTMPRIGKARTR